MRHRAPKDIRILVVDDQADIAMLHVLALRDFTSIAFKDVPVALLNPHTYQGFDVVLMDLLMPQVAGEHALKVIRDYYGDDIIRIAMTGDYELGDRMVATGLAHGLIRKPAGIYEMASYIANLVQEYEHREGVS